MAPGHWLGPGLLLWGSSDEVRRGQSSVLRAGGRWGGASHVTDGFHRNGGLPHVSIRTALRFGDETSGSPGPTGRPLDGWLQIRILLRLWFVPLAAVLAAEGGRIPGSFIGSWYFDCREGHGGRICPHAQQPRWSLGVCTYVMLCGKPPFWGCMNQQLKMMKKTAKGMVQQIGVPHFFMGNIWESDGTWGFEALWVVPSHAARVWLPCQEKFPMEDEVWQAISPEAKES